jgi:hypothetical protein
LAEWSLVAGAIVAAALVFGYYALFVQGQGELSALQRTVGALRSSLAVEALRLHVQATAPSGRPVPMNPFELLDRLPTNYRAEPLDPGALGPVASPGTWVYDHICSCVGYRPIDGRWLDSPSGDTMVWFYVMDGPVQNGRGATQPLQLIAREAYRWQGQLID